MTRLAALLVVLAPTVDVALEPIPDRLVVLTFDDAGKSHFTVARPLLLKHKFGATFFVTGGWDFATNKRDYTTWGEIRQLHADGFEVGNHTLGHVPVTDETVRDLQAQLRGIDVRCREHGVPKPVGFAYPGYAITRDALAVLKEHGVKFARRGGSPEHPYKDGRVGPPARAVRHALILRTDAPCPGIVSVVAPVMGGQVVRSFAFHLYGERAADVAARDEPAWQPWVGERFPFGGFGGGGG